MKKVPATVFFLLAARDAQSLVNCIPTTIKIKIKVPELTYNYSYLRYVRFEPIVFSAIIEQKLWHILRAYAMNNCILAESRCKLNLGSKSFQCPSMCSFSKNHSLH